MGNMLITGGAGFIGAHLARALREAGHAITVVDNLKTIGGIPFVDARDEFLHFDICDRALYERLGSRSFDAIYHLAAQSSGESSYDDPRYDILSNAHGTYMMAAFARSHNVPRFIYTSTCAVYGSGKTGEIVEDDSITPDSVYGVSKYAGELFVRQILTKSATAFTIFRVFNAYGPGENLNFMKKGMVSIYASYMWRGEPVQVKGSLERRRDITYIRDGIDILTRALAHAPSFGQVYNLSSGENFRVRELLQAMLKAAGKPADYPIQELAGTPGDTFGWHASNARLCRDFGWKPQYPLVRGLEEYFRWVYSVPIQDDISQQHPFCRG